MNKYINLLAEHLASQPMEFHDWNADSLLEFLFCCYTEDHPLENDAVRNCYEKMEPFFDELPNDASNHLFRNIMELCNACEQAAFIEGMRIGVHLAQEIYQRWKEQPPL